MSFKIKDNELLEMYNKIWDRVSNIKKEFHTQLVFGSKQLKTKQKLLNEFAMIISEQ